MTLCTFALVVLSVGLLAFFVFARSFICSSICMIDEMSWILHICDNEDDNILYILYII